TLNRLEAMRIEQGATLLRDEMTLKRLHNLQSKGIDVLAQTITTVIPDSLLDSLLEQQAAAEQKLIAAEKEYGPQHIEVLKAQAGVRDLSNKINTRAGGILEGLQAKIDSQKACLEDLKAKLTKIQSEKQKELSQADLRAARP